MIQKSAWRYLRNVPTVVFVIFFAFLAPGKATADDVLTDADLNQWEPFSAQRLDELRSEGQAVFVSMSAEWCGTCKINDMNVLSDARFRQALADNGLVYLKGDWTDYDPKITSYLGRFGIRGVPLYVIYPANADAAPIILPEKLALPDVLKTLAAL